MDIAAPGVKILSTMDGAYTYLDGTSMATPHVSATASLMSAARNDLQPAEIRSDLIGGADAKPAFAGITVSGGRLNAARSLRLAAAHQRAPGAVAAPAPAPARPVKKRTPVRVSLKLLSKKQLRTLLKRGLKVRTGCSERCRMTVKISLDRRTARRLKLAQSSRTIGLGKAVVTGRSKTVTVRLTKRGKRLLARARNARLVIEASAVDVGGTGNRRVLSASFRR